MEADLECARRSIHVALGEPATSEESAWPQDRRDRCGMDCALLQCGLLRGSFVPARALRNVRDLTRHQAQLSGEHTRVVNRIHKLLEDANIKLGSVASDVLGKSGRKMLRALLNGETDVEKLADLALGVLRKRFRNSNWPWKAIARSIIATY